jgi:LmbE family N-acetylglucosaminyl deacetylase
MLSRRPTLEILPDEVSFYEAIDGSRTVAQLEERHPGAGELLRQWHQAEVLELIAPITPPSHPRIVVIEPHIDDAVLSAGGRMLNRSGKSHITVLSVVTRSIFTSYLTLGRPFLDCQAITKLRNEESELACRLIGAEHRSLGWDDAPLRVLPADQWTAETAEICKDSLYLFTNYVPDQREIHVLAEQLARKLCALAPDELWFPMGLGNHVDHRMTRNACLLMLTEARSQFQNTIVSMYEDLPYAETPGHPKQVENVMRAAGNCVTRETEEITDVFEEKARVASVYASQFKSSYIIPDLRGAAEREGRGDGRLGEAYLRLEGKVQAPRESLLARESRGLRRLESQVRRLVKPGDGPGKITIVALPTGSMGKWKSATKCLLNSIPDPRFQIFAPSNTAWQMGEGVEERISVRLVPNRWQSFARIITSQVFRVGSPVVILWRGAYCAEPFAVGKRAVNLIFRLILPFRQLLFARAITDLCCFLDEQSKIRRES